MNWFLEALRKYAVFEGRARRREYWFFFLFVFIISFVLGAVEAITGNPGEKPEMSTLSSLLLLATVIPFISVTVRRLHDTDRTGWWWWISFIPIIGGLWLLVLMLLDGTSGHNQYGSDPKM